ncbi:MAG: lipopolysaccharide biosynthesis protein [Niveispirillum sp.]|uniref:lipopolysaccharide biosynthesis protein n=1 Tax=Niveispirillum sp. TaxID=1917217 RepID=UPI0040359363
MSLSMVPPGAPAGALRRIFGGLGLVLGGKAGAGLISLAYLVIATRALGPHDYGVLVLIHTYVTTVCGIVEFPAWQAVVRYGAEAQRAGDRHRLSRLLRFGARVELLGGLAAILAAALCAPLVGPHLGWPETAMVLALPYSLAVLGSVRSTPAGYLQLVNRFDLLGLHNLVAPMVRLAGAGIATLAGWGLKGFLVAWLLAALCEFISLWAMGLWLARRHLGPDLRRPEPGDPAADNPGIWRFLLASNADVTLTELAGRVAPLVVGWMLGPAAAGLFSVAQRATVLIAQPAQILGNTAYPELARLTASGHGGWALRQTVGRVAAIALGACIPIVAIVWLFNAQIVELIAGPAFADAAQLMVVLVLARALAMAGPPCTAALTALGRPGWSMGANLTASLLFLPALPILLDQFGLAGAGIQAVGQALTASLLLLVLTWNRSRTA